MILLAQQYSSVDPVNPNSHKHRNVCVCLFVQRDRESAFCQLVNFMPTYSHPEKNYVQIHIRKEDRPAMRQMQVKHEIQMKAESQLKIPKFI